MIASAASGACIGMHAVQRFTRITRVTQDMWVARTSWSYLPFCRSSDVVSASLAYYRHSVSSVAGQREPHHPRRGVFRVGAKKACATSCGVPWPVRKTGIPSPPGTLSLAELSSLSELLEGSSSPRSKLCVSRSTSWAPKPSSPKRGPTSSPAATSCVKFSAWTWQHLWT